MSITNDLDAGAVSRRPIARHTRFRAWPLWATLAGVAGTIGTVVTDLRPASETEAIDRGELYAVTPADMETLDVLTGRIGFTSGLVAVFALLVFVALWRTHVEVRATRSTGARLVGIGVVVSASALVLGYGWRGALANYLGPESGLYGPDGLFVYYMLTDFGAYIGWAGVVASAVGIAWMAWVERLVSRVLGTFSGLVAVLVTGAVVVAGVPGLPGVFMPVWLAVTGVWLAVGRSRITLPDVSS
ncbi:hypothetical protein GCM10009775_23520 [Microbacterium aoyamense]|uniref:DUF4386 family protein n=1 Tax=Microbacterium aoyamense TaxID=344166 RepID=A0ABN2PS78_9MICO|nr:hypothetical protein [Microbacterium aoyamense]